MDDDQRTPIHKILDQEEFTEWVKSQPVESFGQQINEPQCANPIIKTQMEGRRLRVPGVIDGSRSLLAALFNPSTKGGWYQTTDGLWRNKNWNYSKSYLGGQS